MESGGSQAVREEGSLGSSAAAAGGQGQGQASQAPLGYCTLSTTLRCIINQQDIYEIFISFFFLLVTSII